MKMSIMVLVIGGLAADETAGPGKARHEAAAAVLVNGVTLTPEALESLAARYGSRVPPGRYWYDRFSGAWGYEGGPAIGLAPSNLAIGGPLRPDASAGNTGVFVNGRELHFMDVAGLQRCTPVFRGRFWVNAQGIGGLEGRPASFDLAALCRQAASYQGNKNFGSRTWHNGDGSWTHHSDATGLGAVSDGKNIFITGK